MAKNSKEEFYATYVIPMNFENGSRILGFIKFWNAVETIVICGGLGLLEYKVMQMFSVSLTNMVTVMCITLIPLGILTVIGVEGCDLVSFLIRMVKSIKNRKYVVRRELYDAAVQEKKHRESNR